MTLRAAWQLAVAAALLVLLATLATVQYRWLGDVSAAERERLRASVRARATEFANDIDREVSNLFSTFQVAGGPFDRDPAGTLADAYARALRPGSGQSLVKAVYLVGVSSGQNWSVQQLDFARRALKAADPEPALPFLRRSGPPLLNGAHPVLLADTIDALTPALIVGIPTLRTVGDSKRYSMLPEPDALLRLVVVMLDEKALRQQLVEPFAAARFGSGASSEFIITIVRRAHPAQIVYSSDPDAPVDEKSADITMPLFTLRPDPASTAASALAATGRKEQVSVTIMRRAEGVNGTNIITASDVVGAWRLLIRGRAGSLDALVARSRRRNLAISLGILGLLAASFVLIIASAQRQHRLARQQMEFVAAVSHELRTPLAVICSAGENLADGVVADREQVKTYGALVQTEGRRLTDMVERVMEFAGIASGTRRAHAEVDLARVLADASAGVEPRRAAPRNRAADSRRLGAAALCRRCGCAPFCVSKRHRERREIQRARRSHRRRSHRGCSSGFGCVSWITG